MYYPSLPNTAVEFRNYHVLFLSKAHNCHGSPSEVNVFPCPPHVPFLSMDPNFHKAWPARADILSYHQGAEQDGRTVSDRSPELSLMQHLDEVSQEPGISPKLRARAKIFFL